MTRTPEETEVHIRESPPEPLSPGPPPESGPGVRVEPRGDPRRAHLALYAEETALQGARDHAAHDTTAEQGGVLAGEARVHQGRIHVRLVEALPAKHTVGEAARVIFTEDTWREASREMETRHPTLRIVGWYHSHPRYGIFLSERDQFLHRHFFPEAWHLALVVDPLRQEEGFFHTHRGRIERLPGYHLITRR
ncbi:MAG: Mov34/MPN/PAD-1 family protein [Euryarchaeota archaeon]|nr:Mov34/MPN/PAD-1 family protein [Euryarchaeota archaeon]